VDNIATTPVPAATDHIFYDDASSNQASSRLLASGIGSFIESGVNKVDISATAIAFVIQPSLNPGTGDQYVLTNFVAAPKANAVDVNGNIDRDYNGSPTYTATISTTVGGPAMNFTSIIPSLGVYDLTGLQYADNGSITSAGKLTLTANGINSNSGNGFVACNPVNVVYFGGTTLANGTSISGSNAPAIISSIASSNVAVFAFNVQDDGGAGGDGAATKITGFKFTPTGGQNQFDRQ